MQYQIVIKRLFLRLIGVILSLNSRCIKGTFNLYNLYIEQREEKMITQLNKNQLKQAETQGNEVQNRRQESENQKMLARQDKMSKTESQSGRSMVEMLGVLAIIGVLSIGGIAGYKYAMNYYQANQIAHEMNIMRTDAKIKIAQGADELILGDPYDDGNINFNNYETDFDCALADDSIIEENVSCRVANAFYIEMKNISQEICRPLSKLIQGMSELIGFEITTETIEADNEECQEGNNNIHAVFSAEAISELKSCKENTDCEELENTPYCDKTRHVCVRCYEDNQCAHTEYCEDNTCKSCDEGLVWNGEKCVECTESTDCAETLVCRNNECTSCETEEECQAKGTNYHCSNASTCIQCGTNEVWGGKEKGCVECTADSDCTDTPDTPKCNTNINKCVPCLSAGDCKNPDKPQCNTANKCVECLTYNDCKNDRMPQCDTNTNTCKPCQPKSIWYKDNCYSYECRSNEDCADKGADYYCYVKEGYEREQEFTSDPSDDDFGGQCRNALTDASWAENKKYALSTVDMNWYSAFRFCKKLNKRVPSYTDLGYSELKPCRCPNAITQKIKEDFPNVADIWLAEEVAGSSGLVWGFNFNRYDLMNQQPKRGGSTDHPALLNYTLCLD